MDHERSIDDEEVTPATWRALELELRHQDGSTVEIGLLRPIWWLKMAKAEVGGKILLSIPEMRIEGEARVLKIEPAKSDSRDLPAGRNVVTGKFTHTNAVVLDLFFDGATADPLGVTANHPLWSASRDDWVAAGELEIGEYVETIEDVAQLTARKQRPGRHKVYNLEVHKDHNFYVSDLGILAHNSCVGDGKLRSPKTIKFSQSSIKSRFSDGRSLKETEALLRSNPEAATQIEPILLARFKDLPDVTQERLLDQGGSEFDVFAVTGNRRLYAARKAGSKVNVRFASLEELLELDLDRKFSTTSAGRSLPKVRP